MLNAFSREDRLTLPGVDLYTPPDCVHVKASTIIIAGKRGNSLMDWYMFSLDLTFLAVSPHTRLMRKSYGSPASASPVVLWFPSRHPPQLQWFFLRLFSHVATDSCVKCSRTQCTECRRHIVGLQAVSSSPLTPPTTTQPQRACCSAYT